VSADIQYFAVSNQVYFLSNNVGIHFVFTYYFPILSFRLLPMFSGNTPMHTTFWLTSLLQIYELKRRYETTWYKTTRLRNVLHPSRLLCIRFSADLTMYWFPVYHFRCKEFKPLVIWKNIAISTIVGTSSHNMIIHVGVT
jgi:hypothetical protein